MEFALIERIRRRTRSRDDVVCGIGDDAAVLQVPAGQQLVVTMDTLVAGVHFPVETPASAIGWKSLAVNLSDLAAMAAQPAWCTLALTLPDGKVAWLEDFLDGFFELADQQGIALVGGDTTRGPLSITVTAHGLADAGTVLQRCNASVGDDIWVTGTLGDAAGALLQRRNGETLSPALRQRLDRPTPRVAAGLALRGLASAAIDISDGLLADLGHVLRASGVSARIALANVPTSQALSESFADEARWPLQLAGGDDYELCFTAAPAQASAIEQALLGSGTPGCIIGTLVAGSHGVQVMQPDGALWMPEQQGFEHFSGGAA